jgi:hypothetical protein
MLNMKFPEVRRFFRAAEAHLDAARSLLASCPEKTASTRGHEVVYLSVYVVECSLKALLLSQFPEKSHSTKIEWFKRKMKHNLERLKAELSKKEIHFPRSLREHLRVVHGNWNSEMRYEIRSWRREAIEKVFIASGSLLLWTYGG